MDTYTKPASRAQIDTSIAALKANNIEAELVADGAAALARIKELIPKGAQVHQGASVTLDQTGISELIQDSGDYDSVRAKIGTLDRQKDADEIRKLGASPDYMLGSVHAATEDGHLLIASASGSQLPAEVGGAKSVIWVVGVQKIVANLDAAWQRLEKHVFPLEDARAFKAYGMHSSINKVIVVKKESAPGRSRVIFIDEAIGF